MSSTMRAAAAAAAEAAAAAAAANRCRSVTRGVTRRQQFGSGAGGCPGSHGLGAGAGWRERRWLALALTTTAAAGAGLGPTNTAAATAVSGAPHATHHAAPLGTRLELGRSFERVLYPHPQALVRGVAADGANGVNAEWEHGEGPGFYIEEQRYGQEAVIGGVLHGDRVVWRLGLRELDWGFARQGPGGNFPATNDPFHSTSFFVEAVAELMLVLRGAAAGGIALPAHLLAQVDSYLPCLHAAARWMAGGTVWRAGLASDAPYTHRRFLVAAALGLTSVLTGDRLLLRRARQALGLGIDAQLPDGVEPELGGYDSSYQARGMAYAEQYLAWLPRDPLATRLRATIARGLAWERTRILPSGEVSVAGNTRANGVMRDHNGVKQVVYPMVAQALLWWGLAAGTRSDAELAARVARWGERHPGQVGT